PLLDEVAAGIRDKGGRALTIELDVADTTATVAAVERAWDELGGLDLVIANAGFGQDVHATKLTWPMAEPVLRVNVLGTVATLTAALPRMVARGSGQLVAISSLAGYRGLPTSAAYSASKAAISTFLESLRVDLAGSGVGVTDVRPGFIATAATAGATYPMPMLMQLDEAVDRILAGVDARASVVAFPLPLVGLLASSRLLPSRAYDALVRRLARS
ncbi:MAG TPA: SDR family NAD(P)-dependent oxidoreductase, partial [Minicystis sp.]|nr:SDR family NAD(P)-dependent oxidoreductase [Minicystis sp.]